MTFEEHRNAQHYVWLLRGRSRVPEVAERPATGLIFQTDWTLGAGQPSYRSLGDVVLLRRRFWGNRLELSCVSRERLVAGKALLEEVLAGLITHRRDLFEDLEPMVMAPDEE